MCIVSYSLNPSFVLPAGVSNVSLSNVTLVLNLSSDGARAQSCQSKPVGTFDRNKNIIYWALGDVTLSSQPQKLLAKFVTSEGEARQGSVEAKWEMSVPGADSGLVVSIKDDGGKEEADPFADERTSSEDAWRRVEGVKKNVSGTYSAQ